ncbi:hypothetical protein KIPB_003506 [Kipferlia bialata]|uniref:Thioesterase n=1 Tax=Kipferlia bialata TaxID=797122 RepID=A0A9K3GHB0_9EUKA|nr:hypothetical protein KIPB_003506 [Kipferlia bialata]|eukprot:g3506.t1
MLGFYLVRVPYNLVRSLLSGPRVNPLSCFQWNSRVHISDVDYNMHMNNSRYFLSMELARNDFIARSGIWHSMVKGRVVPLIAGTHMQYRREIKLFQDYKIDTHVAYWDDKWLYLHQQFRTSEGTPCASAMLRIAATQNKRRVSPKVLIGHAIADMAMHNPQTRLIIDQITSNVFDERGHSNNATCLGTHCTEVVSVAEADPTERRVRTQRSQGADMLAQGGSMLTSFFRKVKDSLRRVVVEDRDQEDMPVSRRGRNVVRVASNSPARHNIATGDRLSALAEWSTFENVTATLTGHYKAKFDVAHPLYMERQVERFDQGDRATAEMGQVLYKAKASFVAHLNQAAEAKASRERGWEREREVQRVAKDWQEAYLRD